MGEDEVDNDGEKIDSINKGKNRFKQKKSNFIDMNSIKIGIHLNNSKKKKDDKKSQNIEKNKTETKDKKLKIENQENKIKIESNKKSVVNSVNKENKKPKNSELFDLDDLNDIMDDKNDKNESKHNDNIKPQSNVKVKTNKIDLKENITKNVKKNDHKDV